MRRLLRGWLLLVVVCGMSAGVGCKKKKAADKEEQSKITWVNFEKIARGMSEQEVNDILGTPTEASDINPVALEALQKGVRPAEASGAPKRQLIWRSGNKAISIYFKDGKVDEPQSSGL